MGLGDWFDDAVDFGADLFDKGSDALGTAWDWGSKNQAFLSGVVDAGSAYLNYMNTPESTSEYYDNRRKEHNAGITAAAERYKKGTL